MESTLLKAFPVNYDKGKVSFKMKQRKLRESGQPYQIGTKKKGFKEKPAKDPEFVKEQCKCKNKCSRLSDDHRLKLFEEIHNLDWTAQNNYLLSLLTVIAVQRRRHGTYDSPGDSRRQCTVNFMVPDGQGGHVQVCKKIFMAIFGVKSSKRIQFLVKNKKMGNNSVQDKRGGIKNFKFTLADRNAVKNHIQSIPTEPSHYNRKEDDNQYMSQDLNLHRLYRAFKAQNPESQVSYQFYTEVFRSDFPKHKFRKPRSDTCKTCDRLKVEICSRDPTVVSKAKKDQQLHHRKAEAAYKAIKENCTESTLPTSDTCTLVIDLQKVFPIPKLSHTDMYYARQLSVYNFGIHLADSSDGLMCLWHEKQSSRGGNQMASCLFRALNNFDITRKRHLVVWSDNCCGQIKNRMMVFLYLYLISNNIFDSVTHKFLVVGHSFSAADRNFALIEKRWKYVKAETMEDVKECIISARHERPFKVMDMEGQFIDFDKAAEPLINTKKLGIANVSQIRVDKGDPGKVKTKKSFSDLEVWEKHTVLKPNITVEDFKSISFSSPDDGTISEAKKADIVKMLPYISENNRPFFEDILLN